MIVAIGTDLTEVERIRSALDNPRSGRRFRDRIFTPGEQTYCERRGSGVYESYAARFAAKEAVMKALGLGWGAQLGWLDIEVRRRPGARPEILLSGRATAHAASLGVRRLHLALTHTATLAEAQVVAEGEG